MRDETPLDETTAMLADSPLPPTPTREEETAPTSAATPDEQRLPLWERTALVGVLLLAAALDFFDLARNGYGNAYYAAAVKSMLASWHSFFFAAFDPGGFVTVDKPPLGLWMQVLSAKLFDFNGVSLILPQAAAGVLSVLVLYHLVRRVFGGAAGLLAALALAISPISVVANRDNILDSLLVLTVLLAALATIKAAESGNLWWLLAAAALVGLGFNIKMLEAFLVVPALALVYLCGSSRRWRVRAAHLGLFAVALLAVSLSWAAIVDLTPAADRPYVGSSQTNSEIELAFGYNGLDRLFGRNTTPKRSDGRTQAASLRSAQPQDVHTSPRQETGAPPATLLVATTLPPFHDQGTIGPLRLLQYELGGQVGWLLPLALLGLFSSVYALRPRTLPRSWRGRQLTPCQQAALLWGGELLAMGVFFSWAVFFNVYYLAMLAPPICALFGIGIVGLWRDYRGEGWRGWLLPLALAATGAEQVYLLLSYASWPNALWPGIAAGCFVAALALALARTPLFQPGRELEEEEAPVGVAATAPIRSPSPQVVLAAIGVAAVLLAPTLWTLGSLRSANAGGFPLSGPTRIGNGVATAPAADPRLVQFLEMHARGTQFLAATVETGTAIPLIFDTGAAVMALGGYTGSDPIVAVADLPDVVRDGAVRYFLLPSSNLTVAQMRVLYPLAIHSVRHVYTNALTRWVAARCTPVAPILWKTNASDIGALHVWDCGV